MRSLPFGLRYGFVSDRLRAVRSPSTLFRFLRFLSILSSFSFKKLSNNSVAHILFHSSCHRQDATITRVHGTVAISLLEKQLGFLFRSELAARTAGKLPVLVCTEQLCFFSKIALVFGLFFNGTPSWQGENLIRSFAGSTAFQAHFHATAVVECLQRWHEEVMEESRNDRREAAKSTKEVH